MTVKRSDGSKYRAKVPQSDLPKHSFALPKYPSAPYILLDSATPRVWGMEMSAQIGDADLRLQIENYGGTFDYTLSAPSFTRAVAKMAHCLVVAAVGCHGFAPFLTRIIRFGADENDPWCRQFIGWEMPVKSPLFHVEEAGCGVVATGFRIPNQRDWREGWLVNITILGEAVTPAYCVFVGQCLGY
jgi:hypothetical protein